MKPKREICFKKEQFNMSIWMMRQWLNEDRITDPKKMVTDKDLKIWFKKG